MDDSPLAPLSMAFSRQEYWSGLLFPTPEDLPDPGIEPWSPALRADSLLTEPPGKPKEFPKYVFFKSPLKWLWFYTLKGEFFRLQKMGLYLEIYAFKCQINENLMNYRFDYLNLKASYALNQLLPCKITLEFQRMVVVFLLNFVLDSFINSRDLKSTSFICLWKSQYFVFLISF